VNIFRVFICIYSLNIAVIKIGYQSTAVRLKYSVLNTIYLTISLRNSITKTHHGSFLHLTAWVRRAFKVIIIICNMAS
jgi:hypothetical protein